jgi:AraC-like DNA-binding protein
MKSIDSLAFDMPQISTQCYNIRSDIRLVVQRSEQGRQHYRFSDQGEAMVELGINLGGPIHCVFHKHNNEPRTLETGPGQTHIGFYPGCKGFLKYPSVHPVCWLGILVCPDLFVSLFDLPSLMAPDSGMEAGGIIYQPAGPLTADMRMAIHQILLCPFQGKTKCLFLESKVLELISHMRFQQTLRSECQSRSAHIKLLVDDREKIWQAKGILDENLEDPPSIPELARRSGINEFKLKAGFRQVFGTTPYRYLADQRLEAARQLLRECRMNVTEAAFAVGYSNLSHFAKIFYAKFGINPSEYLTDAVNRRDDSGRDVAKRADTA